MADGPFGPWRDGPSDPFELAALQAPFDPTVARPGPSVLSGTPFGEFADIEHAMAQIGRDPNPMEIWEIACALGAHRPPRGFGLADAPEAAASDPLAEMIAAEKAARERGSTAEWGAPSPEEEAGVNALLRATGR